MACFSRSDTERDEMRDDSEEAQRRIPGFPDFDGLVYLRPARSQKNEEYELRTYQYAKSSAPRGMLRPRAIVYAKHTEDDADLKKAIAFAREHKLALAIRSGGHQMGGFSSTNGDNLQVDMSDYHELSYNQVENTVTYGVGWRLLDLHEAVCKVTGKVVGDDAYDYAFFAHGNCSHVGAGGHMQTGGYSILTRSLGLYIDYVESFRIIVANGETILVEKPKAGKTSAENDEMWFCILGGSPGNFGIVTETTTRLVWDSQFPESRMYTQLYLYSPSLLKQLLDKVVAVNDRCLDDDGLPAGFNLSVAVSGPSKDWGFLPVLSILDPNAYKTLDEQVKREAPALFGQDQTKIAYAPRPAAIAVQAAWVNITGDPAAYDQTVKDFFAGLDDVEGATRIPFTRSSPDDAAAVSKIYEVFTWKNVREFNMPYLKRNYASLDTNLGERDFSEWMTKRMETLIGEWSIFSKSPKSGVTVAGQWAVLGGKHSRLTTYAEENPTALGWRNMTCNVMLDGFYNTHNVLGRPWLEPKQTLIQWQQVNQEQLVGSSESSFSTRDCRYLFDAFDDNIELGQVDLDALHQHFYNSEETYQRLLALKKKLDPTHVFTPNLFGVGASDKYQKEDASLHDEHARHAPDPTKKKCRMHKNLRTLGNHKVKGEPITEDDIALEKLAEKQAKST
jgi:FAD binding domain